MEIKKKLMQPIQQIVQTDLVSNIKSGMILFVVAVKNSALYPHGNKIRVSSLLTFHSWLNTFLLSNEGFLRLAVKRDRLTYMGEEVHKDKPNEQPLVFPFYRDGVKWFEWEEGITTQEIETFINIMNKYRTLKEEAENDMVTAMWEADFGHIKYRASEGIWEKDGEFDISMNIISPIVGDEDDITPTYDGNALVKPIDELFLFAKQQCSSQLPNACNLVESDTLSVNEAVKTIRYGLARGSLLFGDGINANSNVDGKQSPDGGAGYGAGYGGFGIGSSGDYEYDSVLFGDEERNVWIMSEQETEQLKAMVDFDQLRSFNEDSWDVVLVILNEMEDLQDNIIVLEFWIEAVKHALANGDFPTIYKNIRKLKAIDCHDKPWLEGMLTAFYEKMASEDVLSVMMTDWHDSSINTAGDEFYADLRRFLLFLSPRCIFTLIPMIYKSGNQRLDQVLIQVVVARMELVGEKNIQPLLKAMPPHVLVLFIAEIRNQLQVCPLSLLENLSHHDAPSVRVAAARALLNYSYENIKLLTHLINDADDNINLFICSQLSQRRSSFVEGILMNHLHEVYLQQREQAPSHILNCYCALGLSGSSMVIPFLENILMQKSWKAFLGLENDFQHRKGAVMSLLYLPAEYGADEILQKAAASRIPSIRKAYDEAVAHVRGIK